MSACAFFGSVMSNPGADMMSRKLFRVARSCCAVSACALYACNCSPRAMRLIGLSSWGVWTRRAIVLSTMS